MKNNPVVITAAVLIILTWLQYAQQLVVSFLLSLFIAVIAAAPMGWLKKRGFSPIFSIGTVLTGIVLLGLVMAAILGGSFTSFTAKLPEYQQRLREIADQVLDWLALNGLAIPGGGIREVVDPGSVMSFANSLLTAIGHGLSHTFLIFFTVFFMLLESWNLPAKFQAIDSPRSREALAKLLQIIESTKTYTSIKALMSLFTGLLIWGGNSLIGLDFAVLWGFIAFLLNFIPNIGSIIAAVPAVLLALVQLGPWPALVVAGLYLAVNTVIGNLLEPRYLGQRVGLSTLIVFLSMVFWGWLLGPVGMLLSVPLTMVAKFVAEAGEQTRWVAVMLGPEVQPEKEGEAREKV